MEHGVLRYLVPLFAGALPAVAQPANVQGPSNPTNAYSNACATFADKGGLERALRNCNEAIRLDPKHAIAHYNRGRVYAASHEHDRAIADYSRAIDLNPRFAWAYANRGASYGDKGELDRAIADHSKAIELDPTLAAAYRNRGSILIIKKNYDRAIGPREGHCPQSEICGRTLRPWSRVPS